MDHGVLGSASWWERLLWLLGQRCHYQVSGGSLSPHFQDGQMVLAKPCRDQEVAVGDVVVARHPYQAELLLLKRVSGLTDSQVTLAGSAVGDSTDSRQFGPLPRTAMVAKVTSVLR